MIVPKIKIYTPSCVKLGLIDSAQNDAIQKHFVRLFNVFLNRSPDGVFALSDLMGGHNRDWSDSPMQIVYEKYLNKYNDDKIAYRRSARDAGWFLMHAVENDHKLFGSVYAMRNRKRVRAYKLTGN